LKRSTPAVSPRILAAVSGPQPQIASRVGVSVSTSSVISRSSFPISIVSERQRATEVASEPSDSTVEAFETGGKPVEAACTVERPGRWLGAEVELVQVPAQPY
jgi:hypothetical protein